MAKLLAITLAVLLVVVAIAQALDADTFVAFKQFTRKYNKQYADTKEYNQRLHNFKYNLAKINKLNAANTGVKYAVNQFADMSPEEFRKYPCGVEKLSQLEGPKQTEIASMESFDVEALPTSWDWTQKGAVTPVKDQGQCGSCWAFSTVGNLEGVWFLAGHNLTSLSEQEFVDCSTTSYGCDGGWPFWALQDLEKSPGDGNVDTEHSYSYTGTDGTCSLKDKKVGATYTSYKSYCTEDTAACTEDQMAELLVKYGPLSACLDATPMQFYSSGIDNPSNCDPDSIDHCITIVGYGVSTKGEKFWKIKNSWSNTWGEQGYYYLIRGTGACGINKVITIAEVK